MVYQPVDTTRFQLRPTTGFDLNGYEDCLLGVLLTSDEIRAQVKVLGEEISRFYGSKVTRESPLVALTVREGALPFSRMLREHLTIPVQYEEVTAKSYEGATSTGEVKIEYYFDASLLEGRQVLVIEDIVDTGTTMTALEARLKEDGAANVTVATFLDKPDGRVETQYVPDWTSFVIAKLFVVGVGMDFDEAYRDMQHLAVLNPNQYQ